MKQVTLQSLQRLNVYAALAHGTATIVFAIIFFVVVRRSFRSADIYRIGAKEPNEGDPQDSVNYPVELKRVNSFNVCWWILGFFAFTCIFHILYASNAFGYQKYLIQGWNPIRWVEYAISASIMILILGSLTGLRDVTTLIPLFFLVSGVQGCGFLVEKQLIQLVPDMVTIKAATAIGWYLLIGAWIPIAYSLIKVFQDVKKFNAKIPSWIPFLLIVQFFQYSRFGLVQLKQIRNMGADFLQSEHKYIWLSFQAKLALAGFISYGLLERQRRSDQEGPYVSE